MPATLAKLSPPRLTRVVRRERLHRLLDSGVRAQVVWFAAAAGSGKTTAAAEYLAARKTPVRWYRVDAGDLDLASFFYYLARSSPAARKRKALPIFGPEFAEQPVAFARRFFREFFTHLPSSSTLVFDDLQVAAVTLLPAIIAVAIEELPPGLRMFLLSREQAPATFAGFRGTDRLGVIDEDLLRFDDDEATALLRERMGAAADAELQQRLRGSARGWAAGLVLLSEHMKHGDAPTAPAADRPGQTLFDYFAREVFERMGEAERRFMELTALLPEFTPQAAATVTGRDDAQDVLDDLLRRQLFVTRVAGNVPRYVYHDLFRAFLLDRLHRELGADLLNDARLRAAEAALADDREDLAITLCLDAVAFERAAQLLCARARTLLQQGRRATLRAFVERVPAALAAERPWLDYWLGVASMIDDEPRALHHFERAYRQFMTHGDAASACLVAAQAVLAIALSWNTNAGGPEWVQRLDQATGAAATLSAGDRFLVSTGLLRAAVMDETYRVNEASVTAEVENALRELEDRSPDIDASVRLLAADTLQEHALFTGDPALFERTVAAVTPYLTDRALTSWAKCHWLVSFGTVSGRKYAYRKAGFPYADAHAALQDAWETSQRDELPNLSFAATNAMLNIARAAGDFGVVAGLLARLESECNPAHPRQVCDLLDQKASELGRNGRYLEALAAANAALAAAERAQLPVTEMWSEWVSHGTLLIGLDRCDEAAAYLRERAGQFSGVFMQVMLIIAASAEVWAARRDGAPDYVERLRQCMGEARAMGWANYMTPIPLIVAQLWSDALEHGIERDFIVAAIRRRRLAPPRGYIPSWPWRVRVRVLGRLEIECDDVPVRFGAKAQLKPLELLKVLASAPQHKVDLHQVQAWLWPEATPDAAKAAFEVAVHRLRKLLGLDEAVRLSAGKLQLSADHVWVDAADFEAWLDEAQRELDAQPRAAAAQLLAERLFADYRGRLFGDDEQAPWSIGPRERLHTKFLQLVGGLGRFHEVQKDWTRAAAIYERGLAQDQLAEEFYRGLIRCQLARNEPAAALHTFRRCREILSVVLGVSPAPATMALITKIPAAER